MRLTVLYGSQTGTAQDVAEQIWRESRHYNCTGPVLSLDDFPIEKLCAEQLIVFVVATTGQGDEPDNMRTFWRFLLRRNLPKTLLDHLEFACLGLGDSSYLQYNYAAKKLNKRLQQLGAKPLQSIGLCDDQHEHGLSAVSLPWIDSLFEILQTKFQLKKQTLNSHVFKWQVKVIEQPTEKHRETSELQWRQTDNLKQLQVLENKRTTSEDHFQDVRLLSFSVPEQTNWQPGDVLQVHPSNSLELVQEFFDLLQEHDLPYFPHTWLEFETTHAEMPLPAAYSKPVSLADLVQHVWDLSAQPRQRFFELLALQCKDEMELEKLQELSTSVGLEDYINYVQRPRRSVLEVLQDFRFACSKLTLPVLCELFAHLQPRSYSIASAAASKKLDILAAVVNYRTKLVKPRLGVCSNWLKSLAVKQKIYAQIKPGTFRLPADKNTPLIMVGPGTGIAPFRSIIQNHIMSKASGRLVVFVGCRQKTKDYHFQADFEYWQQLEFMQFFVAFSRDQAHKVYVQHLIAEQANTLKRLICEENAVIMVAGSSNSMPEAVKQAFIEILDNDEQYVEQLVKKKLYQEETWS